MTTVYLDGLGLFGPGLAGWREGIALLQGMHSYQEEQIPAVTPSLLSPNERRRATGAIRLALQVAEEAIKNSGLKAQTIRSVFASSGGDGEIIDKICTALTLPERPISPTHFHNSVHNTPAGYWAIATGCHQASVSLSAYDGSFSAGLLEALTLILVEGDTVLLVAYDYPPPFPLSGTRFFTAPFATALVLSPDRGDLSLAALTLELIGQGEEDTLDDVGLERLRTGNPAARSLPLLQAIARGSVGSVVLPYLADSRLAVGLAPCQ